VDAALVEEKLKILQTSIRLCCISLVCSVQMVLAADRDAALECVTISSAGERLACFDAAYGAQESAPASVSVPDAPVAAAAPAAAAAAISAPELAVKAASEEAFGMPQPANTAATEAEFGLPQSQVETLKSVITRVAKDPVGRLTFHLENGQAWKQTETKRFRVKEEDRPVAVIKQGALGSYKLSVEGGSLTTRVKRIQ
jgi:hypothetical protein